MSTTPCGGGAMPSSPSLLHSSLPLGLSHCSVTRCCPASEALPFRCTTSVARGCSAGRVPTCSASNTPEDVELSFLREIGGVGEEREGDMHGAKLARRRRGLRRAPPPSSFRHGIASLHATDAQHLAPAPRLGVTTHRRPAAVDGPHLGGQLHRREVRHRRFAPLAFNSTPHHPRHRRARSACAWAGMQALPRGATVLALLGLGVLGNGLYQIFFIEGIARTRAGDAALVARRRAGADGDHRLDARHRAHRPARHRRHRCSRSRASRSWCSATAAAARPARSTLARRRAHPGRLPLLVAVHRAAQAVHRARRRRHALGGDDGRRRDPAAARVRLPALARTPWRAVSVGAWGGGGATAGCSRSCSRTCSGIAACASSARRAPRCTPTCSR